MGSRGDSSPERISLDVFYGCFPRRITCATAPRMNRCVFSLSSWMVSRQFYNFFFQLRPLIGQPETEQARAPACSTSCTCVSAHAVACCPLSSRESQLVAAARKQVLEPKPAQKTRRWAADPRRRQRMPSMRPSGQSCGCSNEALLCTGSLAAVPRCLQRITQAFRLDAAGPRP